MAANYYGLDVSGVKNPGGKYFNQYLAPTTAAPQRQKLYNSFGKKYGWMDPNAVAAAHAPKAPETPLPPVTPQPVIEPPVSEPQDTSQLFPLYNKNADITASPTYQWGLNQGNKSLDQYMASRGLTNSGAEIQARNDFQNQLGASEAQRWQTTAETEADRLTNMKLQESNRLERQGQNQWGRLTDVLSFLQANSPMQQGTNSLAALSNIYGQMGGAAGQIGTNAAVIPSMASSSSYDPPDMTPGMVAAQGNQGSTGQWTNILGQLTSGLGNINWGNLFR